MKDMILYRGAYSEFSDFFNIKDGCFFFEPEKGLNKLLEYEAPGELIKSFSDEFLYLFVYSLEISQVGYIMSLASDAQWEYFFDMDIWDRSRMDYLALSKLIVIMMETNPGRFSRWLFYDKIDMIKLYLYRSINVEILTEDMEDAFFDEEFYTNDGVFYFNFVKNSELFGYKKEFLRVKTQALKDLLFRFANINLVRYQNLLIEVSGVIAAEVEENLLRLKSVRLAEKGLLSYDEAIVIYKFITPNNIKNLSKKILLEKEEQPSKFYLPYLTFENIYFNNFFFEVARIIDDGIVLHQLETEFTFLCNKVLVVDKDKIRRFEDLQKIVSKVSFCLRIGVQVLSKNELISKIDLKEAANILQHCSFDNLFRLGYSRVLLMKRKVLKWYKNSWFISQNLKMFFWGEEIEDLLNFLIFSNFLSLKGIYNRFNIRSLYDIKNIEKKLQQIFDLDRIFLKFKINLSNYENEDLILLNFKNLLLTLWALSFISLYKNKISFRPIKFSLFTKFYEDLIEKNEEVWNIKKTKKKEFIVWICKVLKVKENFLPNSLSYFFYHIFDEVEEELCRVSLKDLDGRYINSFIVV